MRLCRCSSAAHMESSLGSSRPAPRPVVPRIKPLIHEWMGRRRISATTFSGLAERGSVAKAYNLPRFSEHIRSSSSLTVRAHRAPSSGLKKSSHGFASEITDVVISCFFINSNFSAVDEYEASIGLPLNSGGREVSLSDGRMISRGGADLSGRSRRKGTVVRERRRER